ncbi:tetratricopeptide repeat protein [Luminiphilus syltensis]|uniref:tetratricopeptide repeat protein n=1 Tax=Luminiphilus syltensis TaxID=1341119 RepID=UPI00058AC4D3|nr:tetratricopeptide repeat protein [Luminiphilus syltensis]
MTSLRQRFLLGPLLFSAVLAGCATQPETPEPVDPVAEAKPDAPPVTPESEVAEQPIPAASVYPLLAAEFALRNRDFQTGLRLLLEQAMILDDPALARRALQLAEFMQVNDAALIAAMRLADLDPDDSAAAATAMRLLIAVGQPARAIEYARKAKAGGRRINAPALLQDFSQRPAAERRIIATGINELAMQYPEDVDLTLAQALLKREQGDTAAAIEQLDALLSREPDDERALVVWTQLALDTDRDKPFGRIDDAVNENPDNERLRLQYARLLASNDQLDRALEQFDVLIASSPRNGDYLLSAALVELEREDYEAGRQRLDQLLALEQRVDEAYYYLGRLEEAVGNPRAAIDAYDRVESGREQLDAVGRAGGLLLNAGELDEFDAFFDDHRWRSPDLDERLFALQGELLQDRKALERALRVYNEGIEIHSESMPLIYSRAIVHEQLGDIAAMEADFRRILSFDPENATTLNALGYMLTNQSDRFEEAAGLIERALALNPGDPATLDSLGWVYFKMGRLEEALTHLERAYQQFPDPEVAAHLGETLWALGRFDAAKAIWTRALRQDSDNTHVNETIGRLGVDLPLP